MRDKFFEDSNGNKLTECYCGEIVTLGRYGATCQGCGQEFNAVGDGVKQNAMAYYDSDDNDDDFDGY